MKPALKPAIGPVLLALAGACAAAPSFAQAPAAAPDYAPKEPLWELRVGGTALHGPAYPGSSETKTNGVGAPLFIYRGDRIRFGE